MTQAATAAPWPMWSGSTTAPVKFMPMTRQQAAKLYHRLRDFERQTRQPGRQDGRVTRNGLAVAHALLFDFLNFRTGQLDPSYAAIARAACISVRSVARGLQALKGAGVLHWLRRCVEAVRDGRFSLEQESNAYAVCPPSQWQGYRGRPEAPPPDPGTWGDHPCGARDALAEAATNSQLGLDRTAVLRSLDADPGNTLAAALARLGRLVNDRKDQGFAGVPA